MSNKFRQGFTLIEMLVVVAIISILAGIVITGVTGFQASARDTKRVADLKQMQAYLDLYFNREGHYPNTTFTTWTALKTEMDTKLNVKIPVDPINNATHRYFYATDADDQSKYALGAGLERDNRVLDDDLDSADLTTRETDYAITYVFTDGETKASCDDGTVAPFGYCID